MKKKIWIWNHYATNMLDNQGGRHYWFARILKKRGYEPTIFCASTRHNSHQEDIDTGNNRYIVDSDDGVSFVFVKTHKYSGNGISRMVNMLSFYRNLFPAAREYSRSFGKPDIIFASSVHPLTLVAGIRIAKKFGIPCICEVRDLWPESLVAYGTVNRKSLAARVLYQGEKWIYKNADAIIMTWEGGKDYILERGWEKEIDLEKIKYINNGVLLDDFDRNSSENRLFDPDLKDTKYKNIIYAGSIRKVNDIGMLLDAARIIQEQGHPEIRFLIYGSGDQKEILEKRCQNENINNVIFKGRVDKKYIPDVLKNAYINLLHNSSTSLNKYGQSQNKLFEYLAAGRGIIQTYSTEYSILEKYNCGLSVIVQNPEGIASELILACSDNEKIRVMGENARNAAYDFDFNKLTNQLINVIESL